MGAMKYLAVSTFNRAGFDLYGRRMMDSFSRFWPQEVDLLVFNEAWSEQVGRARIEPLLSSSQWLAAFKDRHKNRVFRDYRWDAVRFSHKVAALIAADECTDADVLIWVDGDVVTHSPVSLPDLDGLAPKNEWIAWLDRAKSYPECGFYMINRSHPRHEEMMAAFGSIYSQDKIFALPEFHDSYVLEHVVKESGISTKSLSGGGRVTNHPLVNGPLSKWLDHAKGNRKAHGRTPKGERRMIQDEVSYWR